MYTKKYKQLIKANVQDTSLRGENKRKTKQQPATIAFH